MRPRLLLPPGTDDSPFDEPMKEPIKWYEPSWYPQTCSPDLALKIAEDVLEGAHWHASAARYGVNRNRLNRWLQLGHEAYEDGAGPEDPRAQYLNLYLKVFQAVGETLTQAQKDAFATQRQWWLQNHPEARAQLGPQAQPELSAPVKNEPAVVEAEMVAPPMTEEQVEKLVRAAIVVEQINQKPKPDIRIVVDAEPAQEEGAG